MSHSLNQNLQTIFWGQHTVIYHSIAIMSVKITKNKSLCFEKLLIHVLVTHARMVGPANLMETAIHASAVLDIVEITVKMVSVLSIQYIYLSWVNAEYPQQQSPGMKSLLVLYSKLV